MSPLAARRDTLAALARQALAATIAVVPADFRLWCAALGTTSYGAWRLPDGEITVFATGQVDDRHVRITAVCRTAPTWMGVDTAATLPAFDSPAPAAVLEFRDTA